MASRQACISNGYDAEVVDGDLQAGVLRLSICERRIIAVDTSYAAKTRTKGRGLHGTRGDSGGAREEAWRGRTGAAALGTHLRCRIRLSGRSEPASEQAEFQLIDIGQIEDGADVGIPTYGSLYFS